MITVHHLSVLRSVIEKDENFSYFGSTAALRYWVLDTEKLGLVVLSDKNDIYTAVPTDKGLKVAQDLELLKLPKTRHAYWTGLEARARKLIK
jgi:hypothetical protein